MMPRTEASGGALSAVVLRCSCYAAGIVGMLTMYGVLQERIMTLPYGGVMFNCGVFLVFCDRAAATVFSAMMLGLSKEPFLPQAAPWKYLIICVSNVYASTCQYEALKHVTFALLLLAKSFQKLPVMVWNAAVLKKRYDLRDWAVAAAVSYGVMEFVLTGPTSPPTRTSSRLWGYLLLFGFLVLDGTTSTCEAKLFKEHKTTKYNQMFYVNGLSCLVALATLLISHDLVPAFRFWMSHPSFLVDTLMLSATLVGGQFFIFLQVREFGTVLYGGTMNVRQVVSIANSYVQFSHSITGLQVVGLVVVFLALLCKGFGGIRRSSWSMAERQPLVPSKDPEKDGRVPPEVR